MQVLSVLVGATACFLSLPALMMLNSKQATAKRRFLAQLSLIPCGLISVYHAAAESSPWYFLLGGTIVAAIPPTIEYFFLLLLAAGWKTRFQWDQHNDDWLRKTWKCGDQFWPYAVLQFAVKLTLK